MHEQHANYTKKSLPGDSNMELDVFLPLEEANQSMLNLELDKKLCSLIVLYFTLNPT